MFALTHIKDARLSFFSTGRTIWPRAKRRRLALRQKANHPEGLTDSGAAITEDQESKEHRFKRRLYKNAYSKYLNI